MSRVQKEIECLNRLHFLTQQLDDILLFLKFENLIDDTTVKNIRSGSDHAKDIQILLRDLQTNHKLQMLTYEWSILPIENICISIVTDRSHKDFIFNG